MLKRNIACEMITSFHLVYKIVIYYLLLIVIILYKVRYIIIGYAEHKWNIPKCSEMSYYSTFLWDAFVRCTFYNDVT